MADRNPYIPIERARDVEDKARRLYDENRERAAEKQAQLEQIAAQQDNPADETAPAGPPSEKRAGDFPD